MSNKEAVRRLIGLLNGYKSTIIAIIGCLLVSTGLSLCVPLISRRIMDDGFIGGDKSLLIKLALLSMAIYVVNGLIDIVKEKKGGHIGRNTVFPVGTVLYAHDEAESQLFWQHELCGDTEPYQRGYVKDGFHCR